MERTNDSEGVQSVCSADQDVGSKSESRVLPDPPLPHTASPSKRIDQFRRECIQFFQARERKLKAQWTIAKNDGEWIRAGGLALQLDELDFLRGHVITMTR